MCTRTHARPPNSVANVTLEILQVTGLEEPALGFALADRDRLQVDGDVGDEHLVRDLGPRQPQLGRGRPGRQRQVVLMFAIAAAVVVVDGVVIAYGQIRPLGAVFFLGCCGGRQRHRSRCHVVVRGWNV